MGNTGALLLHGLFEHKGRHKINADWFNNLEIETTLIDLPGHGSEESSKGHIETWSENDEAVLDAFNGLNDFDKKILIGHSYGGLVATYAVLKKIVSPDYLILSAPLFEDNYPKFIRSLSRPMATIAPKLRAPSPVNKRNLSTDSSVVEDYFNDPLVFRSLSFRFGYLITEAQQYVNENKQVVDLIFKIFNAIAVIKTQVVRALDQQGGGITASIDGESGHEGYVAGGLKYVDRLRFSKSNFAKNI